MATDKQRLVETQSQLRLARFALEKIAHHHTDRPDMVAEAALEEIFRVGPKQPLQGLVGHERRQR
jgi:hypothetical protein